jgi:hypothetical protein
MRTGLANASAMPSTRKTVPPGLKRTASCCERRAFGGPRQCHPCGEPRGEGQRMRPLVTRGARAHRSCARERASRTQARLSRVPLHHERHTFRGFPCTLPMEKVHRPGLPACRRGSPAYLSYPKGPPSEASRVPFLWRRCTCRAFPRAAQVRSIACAAFLCAYRIGRVRLSCAPACRSASPACGSPAPACRSRPPACRDFATRSRSPKATQGRLASGASEGARSAPHNRPPAPFGGQAG